VTPCQIVTTLMPQIKSEAELKVLLAVASVASEGKAAELSLTDLMSLTGLSRQGVVNGIELGLKRGVLHRQPSRNSYAYWLEPLHEIDQNGQQGRPKVVNEVDRNSQPNRPEGVNEVDQLADKSLHQVDRFENPIHIPDFKDRTNARPNEEQEAYNEIAYIVGHYNAEWLRDKRGFGFVRSFGRWGDQLETLWQRALRHDHRKPGDRAIFRFQDALEGNLDLGVKPLPGTSALVAPPPAKPPFERYEQVLTPGGEVRTIVEIAPNGLVAFEESEELLFAQQLRPLQVALA
jgi:hypothetical protein